MRSFLRLIVILVGLVGLSWMVVELLLFIFKLHDLADEQRDEDD